jgi:ATP-dependent RNA helicase DeaD
MKSETFMLSKQMLTYLDKHGITVATPVQKKIIPAIMSGKDVLVQSETGSGKTLSFAIPIIESIVKTKNITALILVPTRELCTQITDEFGKFSHKGIEICPVYGGVSIDNQIKKLRRASIVVATPGRLLDIIERKAIILSEVKYAVLDEADRMLDMGFIRDIEKILKNLPSKRQTLLFSATISKEISRLSRKFLTDPVSLELESTVKPEFLRQTYYKIPSKQKLNLLIKLLKNERELAVVFCNRKRITETVAKELSKNGVTAKCLNGDMTQANREKVTAQFRAGKFTVLIATDVAARGLHIDGITHVYNYEIPKEPESYTHRIGRTARAGKKGEAISFVSGSDDEKFFRQILFDHKGSITFKQEPADMKSAHTKTENPVNKQKKYMESNKPENTGKKDKKSGKTAKNKKQEIQTDSIISELSGLLQPDTDVPELHEPAESKTIREEDILSSFDFGSTFSAKERKGGNLKSGRKEGKDKAIEENLQIKPVTENENKEKQEFRKHGGNRISNSTKYGRKPERDRTIKGNPETENENTGNKEFGKPENQKRNNSSGPGNRPVRDRKFGGNSGSSDRKPGKRNFGKPGEKKWGNDKPWRNDKPFNEKSRDDKRKSGETRWSNDKEFNDRQGSDNRKPGQKKWSDKPWRNDRPFGDRSRGGKPGFSKNKFGGKKKFGQPGITEKKKVFDVYKASDDGKSFNKEIYNREEDLYTYARSQERGKKGFDKSQLFKHIEPGAFSGIKKSHTPNKNFKKKFNPANKNRRKFF